MSDAGAEGNEIDAERERPVIRLTHSHAEGTLAEGTTRGDGSAEVFKAQRWRWSRLLGMWHVPRSRDRLAKLWEINAAKQALEAAGFVVEVDVDEQSPRSVEQREADLAESAEARAARLQNRAQRQRAAADSAAEASDRISDGIPMGQPILVGHHSEPRHRRDLGRMHRLDAKAAELSRSATESQRRADTAAASTEARYSPVRVGNKIETLNTELRRVARELAGYTHKAGPYTEVHPPASGLHAERLRISQADMEAQLVYWEKVRADQISEGLDVFSAQTINKGDYVRVSGSWRKVARVNQKTVSCETGYSWTDRVPYHTITAHRTAAEVESAGGE
ncbi:DUF3560 domain-containing protein [Kribbella sp. NPDC059898]|uniref:DUF3560 domain-containing protein n=1 Tax=Kribbella sp. NPDC059898 TaxID=3346995 RepID=UPI003655040F